MTSVASIVARRGVTRVCHFTSSSNFIQLMGDGKNLLATSHLRDDARAAFDATDLQRYDGHAGYVCCSIQYPNLCYFSRVLERPSLWEGWVVLLISPRVLSLPGVKFSSVNAATGRGQHIAEGADALEAMFAPSVKTNRFTFYRSAQQPSHVTTDIQAEVLVPDQIEATDIAGIAVRDHVQAGQEALRLQLLGRTPPPIIIAPHFFGPAMDLVNELKCGRSPNEAIFDE